MSAPFERQDRAGAASRRTSPRAIGVAVVLVLIAGLVAMVAGGYAPFASETPAPGSSPVDGVVVAVDSSGLSDVRAFTLRTGGGAAFRFVLGPLENPTEFPPSHLAEHQATSSPVRVFFRVEGDERVVYRLEDAPE